MKQSDVEYIIIHCAATPPDMDIGAKEIDRWHRKQGWLKIGYHWVIRRNGNLEAGRDEGEPGAHARHYNSKSIGVCLVGGVDKDGNPENNFTDDQWVTLRDLLIRLEAIYPLAQILGHRDLPNVKKACPSFDVKQWVSNNL